MNKIEHIGIAVKNLEISDNIFEKLFGAAPYKHEEVASEGVKTSFFQVGPNNFLKILSDISRFFTAIPICSILFIFY